jgi:hypothetical protein
VSQGQLRGTVRARGEEAGGELQHRTQVKPREAGLVEASVLRNATPDIQPWPGRYGGRSGRTLVILTPRDLFGSAQAVGRKVVKTTVRSPGRSRISSY